MLKFAATPAIAASVVLALFAAPALADEAGTATFGNRDASTVTAFTLRPAASTRDDQIESESASLFAAPIARKDVLARAQVFTQRNAAATRSPGGFGGFDTLSRLDR